MCVGSGDTGDDGLACVSWDELKVRMNGEEEAKYMTMHIQAIAISDFIGEKNVVEKAYFPYSRGKVMDRLKCRS